MALIPPRSLGLGLGLLLRQRLSFFAAKTTTTAAPISTSAAALLNLVRVRRTNTVCGSVGLEDFIVPPSKEKEHCYRHRQQGLLRCNYYSTSAVALACRRYLRKTEKISPVVVSSKPWWSNTWLSLSLSNRHRESFGGSGSRCGFHTDDGEKKHLLPPLMASATIMWPRFIYTIRNWFFIYFVIRPYFDNDFDMAEFDRGARQAVSFVSNKLSEGQFDALEGIVEATALEEIKKNITTFSVFQQELIRVTAEDIFFSFPYQIGIIIPDSPDDLQGIEQEVKSPQTRCVEITVVMHVLRGYAEQLKNTQPKSFKSFVQDDQNKLNVMICNYRFFRDFTEGRTDPSWIINMVNHFLPADHARK